MGLTQHSTNPLSKTMNKLTTITPIFLAVLITGCSYGSKYEASEACKEWQEEGTQYLYQIGDYPSRPAYNRRCEYEPQTKKILGLENKSLEAGKLYQWDDMPGEDKVTKRFQF